MTRLHRRIIFYLFLGLFLISAPLVILQTAGYRYSWKSGRFGRVGVLILKSEPREATISLDGRLIKDQTPTSIELPPDEYQITLKKEGYHSWSKILQIKSQQTTFAEDIVLWKQVASKSLFKIQPEALTFSPDLRFVLFFDSLVGLALYELKNGVTTPITDLPIIKEKLQIEFSPQGNLALISYTDLKKQSKLLVISIPDGQKLETSELDRFKFENLNWSEVTDTLYGVTDNNLYSINLLTKHLDSFAKANSAFTVRGTSVWSINQSLLVKSRAGDLTNPPESIIELPNGKYDILPSADPYLLLYEETRDEILLLDLTKPNEIIFKIPGTEVATRVNNSVFEVLASNGFEVWRANSRGETELLRRQAEPIGAALWLPQKGYLILASAGKIETIEFDSRGERNIAELANFPDHQIKSMAVDSRGAILYFAVSGGSEVGLYSIELQ